MILLRTILIAVTLAMSGVEATALGCLQASARMEGKHCDGAPHEGNAQFDFDDFLIVPVRIHLLRSSTDDGLQCRLKEPDVHRILARMNRIWNKAGIVLRAESVVTEQAVVPDGFESGKARTTDFKWTRPEESRDARMVHVYYVHRLPSSGVYMGLDAIFVDDTAALREVQGDVDEPVARVTSHEIGHAMGLDHREAESGLMAAGTTGSSLNIEEIRKVRRWAHDQPWVLTPVAAFEKEDYRTLATIPGDSSLKVRAFLELKRSQSSSARLSFLKK